MAVKCPRCGAENPDYVMYCGTCAGTIKEQRQLTEDSSQFTQCGTLFGLRADEKIVCMWSANCNVSRRDGGQRNLLEFLIKGSNEESWSFGCYVLITNQRFILARQKFGFKPNPEIFISSSLDSIATCSVVNIVFIQMLEVSFSGEYSGYKSTYDKMFEVDSLSLKQCRRLEPPEARDIIGKAIADRMIR